MIRAKHTVAAVWTVITAVVVDFDVTKAENDGFMQRRLFQASAQIIPTPVCGGTARGCIITPSICASRAQVGS